MTTHRIQHAGKKRIPSSLSPVEHWHGITRGGRTVGGFHHGMQVFNGELSTLCLEVEESGPRRYDVRPGVGLKLKDPPHASPA